MAGLDTRDITLILVSLLCLWCPVLPLTSSGQEGLFLLEDVLGALNKMAAFFETDYSDFNMDGLFGVRLCQGNLNGALQDCQQENFKCPPRLIEQIKDIFDRLNIVGQKALPYIQQDDEDYYNIYLPAINDTFTVPYLPESMKELTEYHDSSRVYDGLQGNTCFGRIMGSYDDDGNKIPAACTITEDCWSLLTADGTVGYYTTHQILYLVFGLHSGCEPHLETKIQETLNMSLRQWQKHLCQLSYLDANLRRTPDGRFEILTEDLFLEQVLLCGVLGFQNFLRPDWTRLVLSWQTARGCFTNPEPMMKYQKLFEEEGMKVFALRKHLMKNKDKIDAKERLDTLKRMQEQQEKVEKIRIQYHIVGELLNIQRGTVSGRRLMSEKVMGDDCLAHKTGLAAGTLGLYVRDLVRRLYGNTS